MNKLTISFILLSTFIFCSAQSQNIKKLKESGRDSIIQFTSVMLNEKKINTIPKSQEKIKILANSKEIIVFYNMGFKWDETEKSFNNFDLEVHLTEGKYSISPFDFSPDSEIYQLDKNQKKIIEFATKDLACTFADDERMQIKEDKDFFELIISRGISRGAECYHVNKKTGDKQMVWHETPNQQIKDYIENNDKFIEIK
jgi:hypothetical protein